MTTELEQEVIFKRFPAAKQDQIRALVNYATLMGLTGSDLVSIGGKLTRQTKAAAAAANMALIETFDLLPIGSSDILSRFKLKLPQGTYLFDNKNGTWTISNKVTNQKMQFASTPWAYELPKNRNYRLLQRHSILLAVATGKIVLNF